MYKNQSVSVVMSTYNEKDSIRQCIDGFFNTGYVDEVVIVDNNASAGTAEEVKKTKAKLIHEPKQGYGHGFQAALKNASGDIMVMCEPDGTFTPQDIERLLAYSNSVDIVLGSRTNSTLLFSGANMGFFLKYGNYFVAKLIELLFIDRSPSITDCGCTFRLLNRRAYETIQPYFSEGGSAFGKELTLLALRARLSFCEIPIHYGKRVGVSSVTGSFSKSFFLGLKMIYLALFSFIIDKIKPMPHDTAKSKQD
tara:strand:+ start:3976 stop:4731 length:756 start_codon:yes stop_codon:yes gene_type:complete